MDKQKKENSANEDNDLFKESRYESLRSLGRLVESDMESEMNKRRRISLPVIKSYSSNAHHAIRRNSLMSDYMLELAGVRNKVIQGLVPDINSAHKTITKVDINNGNSIRNTKDEHRSIVLETGGINKVKEDTNILTMTASGNRDYPNCHTNVELPTRAHSDDDGDDDADVFIKKNYGENTFDDSIKTLRERIANFEKQKQHLKSINEDDFQSFLGLRYLDMCQLKGGINSNTRLDTVWPDTSRYADADIAKYRVTLQTIHDENQAMDVDKSRNYPKTKLNSLTRAHREMVKRSTSLPNISKIHLPPKENSNGRELIEIVKKSKMRTKNRSHLHRSTPDIPVHITPQKAPRGVPHHTQYRAHMRYSNVSKLRTLLEDLRKFSSTVQKAEQQEFINKLEDKF